MTKQYERIRCTPTAKNNLEKKRDDMQSRIKQVTGLKRLNIPLIEAVDFIMGRKTSRIPDAELLKHFVTDRRRRR